MDETAISWKADRERFKGLSDAEKNRTGYTWINDVYPNVKVRRMSLPRTMAHGRSQSFLPSVGSFLLFASALHPHASP